MIYWQTPWGYIKKWDQELTNPADFFNTVIDWD